MTTDIHSINRSDLASKIVEINPRRYAQTRNFLAGKVTQLSPFFTHGILSPRAVLKEVLSANAPKDCQKLASEFGWREYYQRVWQAKGDAIFSDLKRPQHPVESAQIPNCILDHSTGIDSIDLSIKDLYLTGSMHNHSRMWVASLCCNLARTHWQQPSQWLFYHLLDGDIASNILSWQWVAGSFANKKYIANQENINKYSNSIQKDTCIDVSYEELAQLEPPKLFHDRRSLALTQQYPDSDFASIEQLLTEDSNNTVLLYSIWNLDNEWRKEQSNCERVLFIEPSVYDRFPMSPNRWKFILKWAREIEGLKIFVGEWDQLFSSSPAGIPPLVIYREHPLCNHWSGLEDPRDWIAPQVEGYYAGFFTFWKKALKSVDWLNEQRNE